MRMSTTLALCLAAMTGCMATEDPNEPDPLDGQNKPVQSGKADGPAVCGAESCAPELCGYDCTTQGAQCAQACASEDDRAGAFVAGSVGGAEQTSFDSRNNPYAPVFSLDNVLVYGCNLWDFSDQTHDGLEIQFEELVHDGFTVSTTDPTQTDRSLDVYVSHFQGPGSYRAEARYASRQDATQYRAADACALDVAADASRGLTGTFHCAIASASGATVSVDGTFGCPENAMLPVFSRWVH